MMALYSTVKPVASLTHLIMGRAVLGCFLFWRDESRDNGQILVCQTPADARKIKGS
jgi:hypothetical protein